MRMLVAAVVLLCGMSPNSAPETLAGWRAATAAELEAALPQRAPVEKERIETEMRTASGIVNSRGQMIAAVVLITAGYAADGRYSHFFLAQAPVALGEHLALTPGAYVVGWRRDQRGLFVHFYDASTGVERGAELARPLQQPRRVESFRIVPPSEGSFIQIGRFVLPYKVAE